MMLALAMIAGSFMTAGITSDRVYAAGGNRQYSLEGAVYQLYTNEACTSKAKTADGSNAVLTTNASGTTGKLEMEEGTYYAKEITPSKGYKLDTKVHKIKLTESNTSSNPASFTSTEPPVYGTPPAMVYKTAKGDKYTDYTDFLRTEFTLKYYDVATKAEIAGATPKDQWTFVTVKKAPPDFDNDPSHYYAGIDWQTDTPVSSSRPGKSFYVDGNGKRVLPLGWFTIEETKAPAGYKNSNEIYYGHIYQKTAGGDAVTVMEGPKASGDINKELVFRNGPSCTYIKKTDASSGKALAGAKLQVLQGSKVIDEWVSTAGDHKIEALKAGTYTLREISAPYGYDIADDVTFVVKDEQDCRVEMKNIPVTVGTTAADAVSGKHVGSIKEEAVIRDIVHLTGLHKGRKYKVSGRLINKATGETIKSGGKEVTSSREFTAESEVMDVKVEFKFDSSEIEPGTQTVVYETLQRVSAVHGEKVPVELQKHENINDADQTIIYPGISTTAVDKTSGTHNLLAGQEAVIEDTVAYTGLLTGEEYILEGELYDKTEERLTGIKSAAEFKPDDTKGTAVMEFSFDGSGMYGHTLVVYETLKCGDTVLVDHSDPDDADQTVYIPKIGTTAGIQADNHEIKDVITYENLMPGMKYVFRGWLVDTVSGEKVPDSDGSVALEPGEECSGQIEMILNTEKYDDMQGHSMSAFEELYLITDENGEEKEVLVASHKDASDENQTVKIYQDIRLQKKVTGNLGDHEKVFEFQVVFANLVPDQAYTVTGDDEKTFNADQSGKATIPVSLRDGQEVTVQQLPKGAKYWISEAPSDYKGKFRVFSEDMADKGAKITQPEGTGKEDDEDPLATAIETVDLFDGTVIVFWENNLEIATLTAVQSYTGIWAIALALALAVPAVLTALIMAGRRRECDEGDEMIP